MSSAPSASERESIRERLLKVLRLAQDGVGGERENAGVLLEKLLRKHSMTLADLEGSAHATLTRVWLPAADIDERTVLSQLALSLFGTGRKLWRRTDDLALGMDLGPAEHAALHLAWDVYRPAFAEARHALVLGFCYKHGLFAPESATASDMSPDARAAAARALAMADTLPAVSSPTPRIGSGD